MRLPDLPPAITARVVPVGYSHIALLLYGYDDTAVTKRISGWRRSDPDFPSALSSGRSPTFDVTDIWQWLGRRSRSTDGRIQNSLRDMARLQPNASGATAERHWLLTGLALRYESGDLEARHWMTALAALRSLAADPHRRLPPSLAAHLPDHAASQRLMATAADATVSTKAFAHQLAQALPPQPAVRLGAHSDVPNPLIPLADVSVPDDLRALAAQSVMELSMAQLATATRLTLTSDEGSLSSHLDTTGTSPEATAFIIGLIDRLAETLGSTWSTAYDPACGEGHLLAALASAREGRPWTVYGQDADAEALQVAAARLLTTAPSFDVCLTDDTLEHDRFGDLRVDVVVADPPQPTRRQRIHEHMDAWWLHIQSKLADEQSMAFVLTSDQPQAQPGDQVLTAGHVLAVVETGQRLRRDTPGRSVLWVLSGRRVGRAVHVIAPRDSSAEYQWPGTLARYLPGIIASTLAGGAIDPGDPRSLDVALVATDDPDQLRPARASRLSPGRSHEAEPDHFSDVASQDHRAVAVGRQAKAVGSERSFPALRKQLLDAVNQLPDDEREFEILALVEQLEEIRAENRARDRG